MGTTGRRLPLCFKSEEIATAEQSTGRVPEYIDTRTAGQPAPGAINYLQAQFNDPWFRFAEVDLDWCAEESARRARDPSGGAQPLGTHHELLKRPKTLHELSRIVLLSTL